MRGGTARAPCNASSRGAGGGAELFVAGAADAVKNALRAVHHDVVGDALRIEGHECARGGVCSGVEASPLGWYELSRAPACPGRALRAHGGGSDGRGVSG